MKERQLLLELLLLKERFAREEVEGVKRLIEGEDESLLNCLQLLYRFEPKERKQSVKPKQGKRMNLKKTMANLRQQDAEKYRVIKAIEETLHDTKNLKLQQIREYADGLGLTYPKGIKRPTLIRQILTHLIYLPMEELVLPENSEKNNNSALEVISKAIISK